MAARGDAFVLSKPIVSRRASEVNVSKLDERSGTMPPTPKMHTVSVTPSTEITPAAPSLKLSVSKVSLRLSQSQSGTALGLLSMAGRRIVFNSVNDSILASDALKTKITRNFVLKRN